MISQSLGIKLQRLVIKLKRAGPLVASEPTRQQESLDGPGYTRELLGNLTEEGLEAGLLASELPSLSFSLSFPVPLLSFCPSERKKSIPQPLVLSPSPDMSHFSVLFLRL